ncbi:Gfo/Idh/MocA family oxidoreductase [uncultured Anaerococcus sp.]|uniref:Gfo/Idh/MocA family protein n=1 Tax=uncultured Anaerococcus sp. TaxID=293428 RepID=UPI002889EA68|nr:Gfo/Idh/MocA family oxidoreductase [uncultured Anaerococcus sp.]
MKLGIIGAGKIAQEVLTFINEIEGIDLVAIAATPRSEDKLKNLSEKYGIDKYYTDYEELLVNPDVKVVYVALPNNLHYEVMDKALDSGKDIICEKPFTANVNQALRIFKKAEAKGRIVLEAVSNRFIPNAIRVKEEIGKLGKIKIVSFNYSQYSSRYDRFKAGDIAPVFSLENAGGALMDLNIYNIDYAISLFGRPKDVRYFPNIEKSIDTSGVCVLDYEDFKVVCIGAKDSAAGFLNSIQGEAGTIEILDSPGNFGSYRIKETGKDYENHNENGDKSRLYHEFVEFEKIIRTRNMEKVEELKEITLTTAEILNQARIEAGIFFPADREN